MFPFILQGDNINIVVDGKPYTVNRSHLSYEKLREAIKADDEQAVRALIEPAEAIIGYAFGNVRIENGQVFWRGEPMHNALSNKMIEMFKEGFPIDPLVNLMHNLMQNPSKRAVEELYPFLEKGHLPITPDGHFLAFKKVRDNYLDCHSGTISNHVGAVVTMERNKVDDDKDRTCSAGLHFCSQDYLKSFGGQRIMILKINPADVVSIPSDYNDTKGRCCRYEVIGELDAPAETAFTKSVMTNAQGIKQKAPKEGSSAFYKGYSDGFNDRGYNSSVHDKDYNEGYDKGDFDAYTTGEPRYIYIESTAQTPKSAPASSPWPFPVGNR